MEPTRGTRSDTSKDTRKLSSVTSEKTWTTLWPWHCLCCS
ncbi:unnamed protein product [Tetraodon nigroviridis]|uniref:Chromosome 13 SCAF15035, whole genome shotgun sequence n=1 Tax=Tetraodon nigroviridis TaxID=99883 RepID=Q4RJP1_TETNG|nr:unnamed protein product [Tetraodon nigroviridis]